MGPIYIVVVYQGKSEHNKEKYCNIASYISYFHREISVGPPLPENSALSYVFVKVLRLTIRRVECVVMNDSNLLQKDQHDDLSKSTVVSKDDKEIVQGSQTATFDTSKLDPLFMKAYELVIRNDTALSSFLQRSLGVPYSRAAKLMDELEAAGVVGRPNGSKPRVVIGNELNSKKLNAYMKEKRRAEMEQRSKDEAQYQTILANYKRYIDKFCEIAYREVTTLDEWGDENLDCLIRLKQECIVRIAKDVYKEDYLKNRLNTEKYIRNLFDNTLENATGGEKVSEKSTFWVWKLFNEDLPKAFEQYRATRKPRRDHIHTDFSDMSGTDFENYVGSLLIGSGFNVSGTPKTGDQGADLIATKHGKTYVIQVKKYANPVGNAAVQEVVAARGYYNGEVGVVITNSTFTTSARALAAKNNIILIDKHRMKDIDNFLTDSDHI